MNYVDLTTNEIEYLMRCTESDSLEVLRQIKKSDAERDTYNELYFKIKLLGKLEAMLEEDI